MDRGAAQKNDDGFQDDRNDMDEETRAGIQATMMRVFARVFGVLADYDEDAVTQKQAVA